MLQADEIRQAISDLCDCSGTDRHRRATRNVIDHERQTRALSDLDEIFNQAALRRFDVVRRDYQQCIGACLLGSHRQLRCFSKRLRSSRRHYRDALRDGLNRDLYQLASFFDREAAGLGCGAIDHHAVRAFAHLSLDQFGEFVEIDFALAKRRHHRSVRAAQKV